jgi:hypothetical protein
MRLERSPYTQNTHYLQKIGDDYLAYIKEARNPSLKVDKAQELEILAAIRKIQPQADPEILKKFSPNDEKETELELMAGTYAYFKVRLHLAQTEFYKLTVAFECRSRTR